MKKNLLAFLFATSILFYSCKKEMPVSEQDNLVKVDYLPGACPYDCHDTRCTAYLNGYCGPVSGTAPDQLPTAQFINILGSIHNNLLTYGYRNANLAWTDGYNFANTCMTAIANFYATNEGGMTVPFRADIVNFAASIFSNYSYYGAADGKALDQIITTQINQIAPTRNINERNLLLSALNIYHFDASLMTMDQMFNNILARANPILVQYNQIYWPANTGDCIGGYLQIVIHSANYWKYVNDYGVPPPNGGSAGNAAAAFSVPGIQPNLSIKGFFKALAWPELDAGGYLWGWGKSYFGGEQDARKRIKAGLTTAGESSFGGWLKS